MPRRKSNKNSENINTTESNEEMPVQSDTQEEQSNEEFTNVPVENGDNKEEENKPAFVLPKINISVPQQS